MQDDDLRVASQCWRKRALRGELQARGIAHELEREIRRRFGLADIHVRDGLRPLPSLAVLPHTTTRNRTRS